MKFKYTIVLLLALWISAFAPAISDPLEMDDLPAEQAKEKIELENMKNELKGIKGEVNSAIDSMGQLTNMLNERAANPAKEYHLFARETFVDVGGGVKVKAVTYNGSIPGPQLDVSEGQPIRIVLHNQTKVPTSLHFHGMIVPHDVDGLPRSKSSPAASAARLPSQVCSAPPVVWGPFPCPNVLSNRVRATAINLSPRLPAHIFIILK